MKNQTGTHVFENVHSHASKTAAPYTVWVDPIKLDTRPVQAVAEYIDDCHNVQTAREVQRRTKNARIFDNIYGAFIQ